VLMTGCWWAVLSPHWRSASRMPTLSKSLAPGSWRTGNL
jgi:hypothetical protein